jgi:hypothetical protein
MRAPANRPIFNRGDDGGWSAPRNSWDLRIDFCIKRTTYPIPIERTNSQTHTPLGDLFDARQRNGITPDDCSHIRAGKPRAVPEGLIAR